MDNNNHKGSVTSKGITGMLWNLSGSVIQILLQFVVIGILARLLTPEEFGIVAVMMILVNFSSLFSEMGISTALIQLPSITEQHIAQGYTLAFLIGLSIGIAFYFFAPTLAAFFDIENADNAVRFFALFFPLGSINGITSALLSRKLRFKVLVKVGAFSYLLGLGPISITLALLDFGFWSLIWGQFASLIIAMSVLMYYERPVFSFRLQKPIVKELLFFGSGHTLGSIFNYFAENADNIIVGKSLGTVALGIYSKAFQLLAVPAKFFGGIFDSVLFPILSQKQAQKTKLSDFYLFSTAICFGLLLPVTVLIYINAEFIVNTLLGDQWNEVVLPLQILIFGLAYRFGTKINKSYIKSMGLVYRGAYYQFIFAFLMIVCCLLGSLWGGLNGVAFGVLVATVLNYLQVSYRLYVELQFSKSSFSLLHGKTLLCSIPFILITVLLNRFGIVSVWVHLGLSLFVYLPLLFFLFFHKKSVIFNEENLPLITHILKSFPGAFQKVFLKFRFFQRYYAQ
ncbi:lipopolysaccharide biosynthesis protein [Arenibacter sp. GZD96]|uniref:lipopolysaccharide biosynthesis protein n=1 Tax=Aurantibrevibacter litoralis TaxID=3106030 RepID=UPI002AFF57C8|nr:lipopolysaccharide biosynthesis protein [Arenibacter sp. GZD-96]MEA1787723.1 lipopolysaccharide biosynthesis protein [Arenibacter sp. GZD-96]